MNRVLFIISINLLTFDDFASLGEEILKTTTHPPITDDGLVNTTAFTTTTTTASTTTMDPELETQGTGTRRRRTPPGWPDRQTKGKAITANETGVTEINNKTDSDYDSESEEATTATTRLTGTTKRKVKKVKESDSYDENNDKSDEEWYLKFRDRHNLPEPFQLPGRKRIVEIEDMARCRCPRVYWPVCAQNNITYLNYCIMTCLDQEIRRYGPCIYYRRSGDNSFGFLSDK